MMAFFISSCRSRSFVSFIHERQRDRETQREIVYDYITK
jgi:hypothetical protein